MTSADAKTTAFLAGELKHYLPILQDYQRMQVRIGAVIDISYLLAELIAWLREPEWNTGLLLQYRIDTELEILRTAIDSRYQERMS